MVGGTENFPKEAHDHLPVAGKPSHVWLEPRSVRVGLESSVNKLVRVLSISLLHIVPRYISDNENTMCHIMQT